MTHELATHKIAGQRVLIVEDEYFIAMGINLLLTRAGYVVVGPVGRLDRAMEAARVEMVDAALLDINLRNDSVYPVADILTTRSIPFTFLSGYSKDSLPPRYRNGRILSKPFQSTQLIDIIGAMLIKDALSPDPEKH